MINNIKNYKKEESVQLEIYSKMSYAQKWKEFHKLREAAWVLKTAGIRAIHPDWSEEQVQAEVRKIFLYATT
ncbi:MAG: hypothetical protein J0M15_05930 [Deltaproteobacteria bacterium]|jgi:hypothetical protein|nr:hypothetical protein [Deltaproteobacteria bacterium]